MTTEQMSAAQRDVLVRKLVRVHRLKDPLGALGQRRSRARIDRESAARRRLFVAVLAFFVACLGIIAGRELNVGSAGVIPPSTSVQLAAPGSDDERLFTAPAPDAVPRSHARTRATS